MSDLIRYQVMRPAAIGGEMIEDFAKRQDAEAFIEQKKDKKLFIQETHYQHPEKETK